MEVPPLRKREFGAAGSSEIDWSTNVASPGMILAHGDARRHVAIVVAHGVQVAVVLAVGIEVSAGSLEVGGVTDWILVDMHGVHSKLDVFELNFDLHALLDGLEGCKAGVLTGCVQNAALLFALERPVRGPAEAARAVENQACRQPSVAHERPPDTSASIPQLSTASHQFTIGQYGIHQPSRRPRSDHRPDVFGQERGADPAAQARPHRSPARRVLQARY